MLGLALASSWIGTPLPPVVESYAADDPVVAGVVAEVRDNFTGGYLAGASFHRFALKVWHHPRDRFLYLWYLARLLPERIRALATPSENDRKFVDLHDRLSFLYAIIRPVRTLFQQDLKTTLRRLGRSL